MRLDETLLSSSSDDGPTAPLIPHGADESASSGGARARESRPLACKPPSASVISRLFGSWVWPLLKYGLSHPLQMEDLPDLPDHEAARGHLDAFEDAIGGSDALLAAGDAPLLPALVRAFRWRFFVQSVPLAGSVVLQIVTPVLLQRLLACITEDNPDEGTMWRGLGWLAAVTVARVGRVICRSHQNVMAFSTSRNMKAVLRTLLFDKSTVLAARAAHTYTMGEIINITSSDTEKLLSMAWALNDLWSSPILVIGYIGVLWWMFGPAVLAGLAALIAIVPINYLIFRKNERAWDLKSKRGDERVRVITDLLNGIRIIKLFAWEKLFRSKVDSIRAEQMALLRTIKFNDAFVEVIWMGMPTLMALLTIMTYTMQGNTLTTASVFAGISVFHSLTHPMFSIPWCLMSLVEARVSLRRIQAFLACPLLDPTVDLDAPPGTLSFDSVTAEWGSAPPPSDVASPPSDVASPPSDEAPLLGGSSGDDGDDSAGTDVPTLSDICLDIRPGMLVGVVGAVGAGKSSLLHAALGEMHVLDGVIGSSGSIAYVAQNAWIQNATLRANILFSSRPDIARYHKVVRACALEPDLAQFEDGDLTEIGEKGVNLSGGQRQRVALARATYADADIYLLDDCLSAVDPFCATTLFDECITGMLEGKTRVLVTHYLHLLPRFDYIVYMDGGKIIESGTYDELMQVADGPLATLVSRHIQQNVDAFMPGSPLAEAAKLGAFNSASSEEGPASASASVSSVFGDAVLDDVLLLSEDAAAFAAAKAGAATALVEEEDRKTGAIGLATYTSYLGAGGWTPITVGFILAGLAVAVSVVSDWWLGVWSKDPNGSIGYYLGVYAGLALVQTTVYFAANLGYMVHAIRSARLFHDSALGATLASAIGFFERTPSGRIINRFGFDMDKVDGELSWRVRELAWATFEVAFVLVLVGVVTPAAFAVCLTACAPLFYIQKVHRSVLRELARLKSQSYSPINALLSESLRGLSTIRAFGAVSVFRDRNLDAVDVNMNCGYYSNFAELWTDTRLEATGYSVLIVTSFIGLVLYNPSPTLTALAVINADRLVGALGWGVVCFSKLESDMASAERVTAYTELEPEVDPRDAAKARELVDSTGWKTSGAVEYRAVDMRYRPELPLALRGVSFTLQPGEKVGVVGRSGSGKTSLISVLFRLNPVEPGSVIVGGQDIAAVSLDELRSTLSIIPQESVVFLGSVRSNLDPYDEYTDAAIWAALADVGLSQVVAGLSDGLATQLRENASGFSVGQLQLLCLARALLKQAPIIVCDEATSSADADTDAKIQETIRTKLAAATVISIAHRLHSVVEYDKVLVMDAGHVVEFDAPDVLLATEGSIFGSMVDETGAESAARLRHMAVVAAASRASRAAASSLAAVAV